MIRVLLFFSKNLQSCNLYLHLNIAQDTLGDGVTPVPGSEVTIAQQTTEGSTIATEGEGQGHQKEGPSIMIRVELTPGFDGSKST